MPRRPPAPPLRLALDSGWTLRQAGGEEAPIPATVPGCVHTDLLAARAIPDPLLDRNELDVAWVADADWTYRTALAEVPDDRDRIDLVFAGLDTLAEITIDGTEVARTANMHRAYRFEVGELLAAPGEHELEVTFPAATRAAEALRASEGEWPSSSFGRPFNYLRKMACSWGWDWGPWLTTAGIWRPATLHAWDAARLRSVRPAATVDDGERGRVAVAVAVERVRAIDLAVDVDVADSGGRLLAGVTSTVPAGADEVTVTVDLDHVERWWPAGQGGQPLYALTVRLRATDSEGRLDSGRVGGVLDTWQRRIGFRTIDLDTTPDATGAAFTFVVNGRPIFARGVNWIPDDPFPSRVTPARYRERLQQAVDANVDLVRVWGGGIYEDDSFYDACDELGLLVWQDFTFACAAYPEHLLADEVDAEARDNVARLMPHASLALWNGNNENIWGFYDWNWQPVLEGRPWGLGFYLDLLPRAVADVDPARPYWPGSPYSGSVDVHPNADAHGCVHEWRVWNQLDHGRYRDRTPRFVAEFGWQAPPTYTTLRNAVSDEPLAPASPGVLHHQKATDGNEKLHRGLDTYFDVPEGIDAWLWATQLNQARAVRTGVEHFRSLRGACMGTVWWQLNDCWPVTSWAVVDGGGRRKPAWYALRDAYAPHLLTIQPRGGDLVLFAVNDGDEPWTVAGAVERCNFAGELLVADDVDAVTVAPRSLRSWTIPAAVARAGEQAVEVLVARAGGAEAWWWYRPDRELRYPGAALTIEPRSCPSGDPDRADSSDMNAVSVTVAAGALVRDLAVMADRLNPRAEIDRMLVSLLPGESTTFTVFDVDVAVLQKPAAPPVWWTANDLVARR